MTSFSLPSFSRLSPKIARAERELAKMEQYWQAHSDDVSNGDWGAVTAISSGIHNVYNGIEDVLLSLAKDIDDSVPTGAAAHQDILDQMAAEVSGMRPAVLDPELYEALTDIKGFRHLVRHRYGFDLKPEKVVENLALVRKAFPSFVEAVVRLEKTMNDGGEPGR